MNGEKRYQEVRSLVDRVSPIHKGFLKPVRDEVIQYSQGLWNNSSYGNHSSMGEFYVSLTRAFYGGTSFEDSRETTIGRVKPDIVSPYSEGESKAWRINVDLPIKVPQLKGYEENQLGKPHKDFYYAAYAHNFDGVRGYTGSLEELFADLSKNTQFGLVLPLSVVSTFNDHAISGGNHVVRYSKGTKFPPCTYILSKSVDGLFEKPGEVLKEIGLSEDNYDFERYWSPKNFKSWGNKVKPFPILRIKDKDRDSWVEKLRGKIGTKDNDGCSDNSEGGFEYNNSQGKEDVPF